LKEIAKFELYSFLGAAVLETPPNAKPRNVMRNFKTTQQLQQDNKDSTIQVEQLTR